MVTAIDAALAPGKARHGSSPGSVNGGQAEPGARSIPRGRKAAERFDPSERYSVVCAMPHLSLAALMSPMQGFLPRVAKHWEGTMGVVIPFRRRRHAASISAKASNVMREQPLSPASRTMSGTGGDGIPRARKCSR